MGLAYRCRFCKGDRVFDTFMGLRNHVIKSHNHGYCEVCKKEYKNLRQHVYRKAKEGDREHMIYYGLMLTRMWDGDPIKKACRQLAEEVSRVVVSTIA